MLKIVLRGKIKSQALNFIQHHSVNPFPMGRKILSGMKYVNVAAFGTFLLLMTFCSRFIFTKKEKLEKPEQLAQKAIFEYLQQPKLFFNILTGKGLPKIDSSLCVRGTLIINGKAYFEEPMHSDLLKYPLPEKTCKLVIPDSLLNTKYKYTDNDKDYVHDYGIIYQFSPLLPTNEPDIFLMERCIWANTCEDDACIRILSRGYLKFKIEGPNVIYLDDIVLYEQDDLIVFGSFSRQKMEEALPGEKITKFGH